MKLRMFLNLILLLLLFFINDSIYQSRGHLDRYLEGFKIEEYNLIEDHESVIILNNSDTGTIINNLSNQYYIDSVQVIQKVELIEMLSSQYRLSESKALLEDLSLPKVLKCSFRGDKFRETESEQFLDLINTNSGVSRLLYSDENYQKSWEIISIVEDIENMVNHYWFYLYYGFGLVILLVILDLSIIREKDRVEYWSVFLQAGGSRKKRLRSRLLTGIMTIILPGAFAIGLEYYFSTVYVELIQPDLNYHILRACSGIIISLAGIIIIRNRKYV